MSDTLLDRLWENDSASALTNEAARRIEALEADARVARRVNDSLSTAVEQLNDDLKKADSFVSEQQDLIEAAFAMLEKQVKIDDDRMAECIKLEAELQVIRAARDEVEVDAAGDSI